VDNQWQMWIKVFDLRIWWPSLLSPSLGVNTSHPMSKPDAGSQALVKMPCLIDDTLDAAT
jgi:hypothetical protein